MKLPTTCVPVVAAFWTSMPRSKPPLTTRPRTVDVAEIARPGVEQSQL